MKSVKPDPIPNDADVRQISRSIAPDKEVSIASILLRFEKNILKTNFHIFQKNPLFFIRLTQKNWIFSEKNGDRQCKKNCRFTLLSEAGWKF